MKAGFAKERIHVAYPCHLAGYAVQREAWEAYDDIFVKVCVIQQEKELFGCISLDVIAIDHLLMERIYQILKEQKQNIDHFIISATHTHAAPGGMLDTMHGLLLGSENIFQLPDDVWLDTLAHTCNVAFHHALMDLKDASIAIAEGHVTGIGKNRNDPVFPGNEQIYAVFVKQTFGREVVLVNYACHPTVLSADNDKVSSDFPGYADTLLQNQFFFCMYLNGCGGDISTRFTRKGSTYEEVKRFGSLFAEKISELYKIAIPIQHFSWNRYSIEMELVCQPYLSYEEAKQFYEEACEHVKRLKYNHASIHTLRLAQAHREGAEMQLRRARYGSQISSWEVAITIWKMNHEIFIIFPGELYSQLANPIMQDHVHVLGYSNGYLGYFADEQAYEAGYYEALSSPFAKGEAERLIKRIQRKIQQLQEEQSCK